MMRYLTLLFVLLSTYGYAVLPPDGRLAPDRYQAQITRLIVKPSDSVITATDDTDKQAIRAAFAKQAVRNATGIEMRVLRHLATGAVLLELPDSVDTEQARKYADSIAQQLGIKYAEPDQHMWPMQTPQNSFHQKADQKHLKAPADGGIETSQPEFPNAANGSSDSDGCN